MIDFQELFFSQWSHQYQLFFHMQLFSNSFQWGPPQEIWTNPLIIWIVEVLNLQIFTIEILPHWNLYVLESASLKNRICRLWSIRSLIIIVIFIITSTININKQNRYILLPACGIFQKESAPSRVNGCCKPAPISLMWIFSSVANNRATPKYPKWR